tara:strand:+ start:1996 stop:2589 length:594 start_codon:yes stop_codon:yes gene_type:complete
MRREEFAKVMSGLQVYYRHELSETELGIYWSALQGWEVERLRQAAQAHVVRSKWFPRLSELAEAVGGSETDAASEAWQRVIRAVGSVGRYRSVDFGAVENAATASVGGWAKLCRLPEKDLPFIERRWKQAFDYGRRAGVPPGDGRHLIGEEEADRIRLGASEPAQVLRLHGPTSRPPERLSEGVSVASLVDKVGREM